MNTSTSTQGNKIARILFKRMFLVFVALFVFRTAFAQKSLKIQRMRQVTWDTYNKVWSPWPTTWSTYQQGNEPILTITRMDDNGYQFKIDMLVGSQTFS